MQFIDGLRGIACLAVVFFHLYTFALNKPLSDVTPVAIDAVLRHGYLGVQIFFVISGFVISYTLAGTPATPGFAANFMIRRSIRLDPTYWLVLVFSIGLHAISSYLFDNPRLPGPGQIALNFVYLQELFGHYSIMPVAWTLCVEMQFYLVYILLLVGVRSLDSPGDSAGAATGRYLALLAPLALLGVAAGTGIGPIPGREAFGSRYAAISWTGGLLALGVVRRKFVALWGYVGLLILAVAVQGEVRWFLPFWPMFLMGDLAARVTRKQLRPAVVVAFLLLAVSATQFGRDYSGIEDRTSTAGMCVASATSFAILTATVRGGLGRWLSGKSLQYFGTLSYALYLTHVEVGGRFLNLGLRLTGDNQVAAIAWVALAFAGSVGMAHLVQRWVEIPTQRLSRRLKPTS